MTTAAESAEVAVLATGTANVASVLAAFARLGARAGATTDPRAVATAPYVVLPGVGAFGAAMHTLRAHDLVAPLRARFASGAPTLAICLGLQLLAAASDETQDAPGLALFPARITRFSPPLKVPQLGWNTIAPAADARLLRADAFYFANSFCLREAPAGWVPAYADYGGRFVAALERGRALACQFHPELSGAAGAALLRAWIEGVRS